MTRSVCTCTPLCVRDGADTAAFCTPSRNSRCSAGPHRSASLTSRRRRSDHLVCCASAATLSPVEASAHLLPSVELWSYDSAGARRQGLTGATPPYSGLHASRVEPVEACAVPAVEDPRNWACRAQLPAVSTALRSDRVAARGFATFDTALDVPPWLASEADGQPVPAPPGSSGGGGGGKENEYYLQCGVAIRTIRDEFPNVFRRDLSYDIYRDDLVFTDAAGCLPGVPAQAAGKDAYRRVFWSLRLHGALFFARPPLVSILRIWQPRDGTLAVRWSIAAQPRLLSSFGADDVHFDGISEYKLDRKGRIYEHRINNVDWGGQEPQKSRSLAALLASLAPSQVPTPSFMQGGSAAASASDGPGPVCSP